MKMISCVLSLALGVAAVPAAAALVLDQEHVASGDSLNGFSSTVSGFRRAQTVTAGMGGTLAQVHVQLYPGAVYQNPFLANVSGFNILSTVNGVPQAGPAAILGTGSFVELQGDWAVFSTSLAITQGQVFAIEPVTGNFTIAWHFGGFYGGGRDYFLSGSSFVGQLTGQSVGFRTFFDNSPTGGAIVPEPDSWAMMIVGFGLVGASLRRRSQRTLALQGS